MTMMFELAPDFFYSKKLTKITPRWGKSFVQTLALTVVLSIASLFAQTAFATTVKLDERVTISGPLVQGGLVLGKAPSGSIIHLNKKLIRQSPEGDFAFGFGRDAAKSATLSIKFPDGEQLSKKLVIEPQDYKIQQVEGVPQRTVTPDPKDLERIRKESAAISKARATNSNLTYFKDGFSWPLLGPITGVYGSQRVYNGEPKRPHFGLDIAAPTGTPVKAPADGVVTLTHPDMFYSGGTLLIDHGYGISTTFIHLSKVIAKEGQTVKRGDIVAEVGQSGRSTGPHLDWRINWFDVKLDPALIMPEMPAQ